MLPEQLVTGDAFPAACAGSCSHASSIQYLFTIVPLRQIITTADDTGSTVTNSQLIKLKRIGGRQITLRELERSKRCQSMWMTTGTALIQLPSCQRALAAFHYLGNVYCSGRPTY